MTRLTARQRQYLKGLAHALKPILHIGKEGLTQAVLRTIERAFDSRELLKVKVLDAAPDGASELAEQIAGALAGVEFVQVIGKTIVLYRRHPEKPAIKLPARGPAH